jgi:hypothetical protein
MSEPVSDPRLEENLEASLVQASREFVYPPAPDVSRMVTRRLTARRPSRRQRGWVLIGVALALVLVIIFTVPPVRAAVLDWIRLGAVRIFLVQPTSTPTPAPQSTLPALTPSEEPIPTPLQSVLDLAGETTLAKVQAGHILKPALPAFPPDLGLPNHVYFQIEGWPVIVMVWMDPANPQAVRLVISETDANGILFQKMVPPSVLDTFVNGQPALWVAAPYMLLTGSGEVAQARLVENSHTLIWTAGPLTFRLETGADLETALRIAESIK